MQHSTVWGGEHAQQACATYLEGRPPPTSTVRRAGWVHRATRCRRAGWTQQLSTTWKHHHMQEKHLKVRTQAVAGEGSTQGTVRVVTLHVGPPRPDLSATHLDVHTTGGSPHAPARCGYLLHMIHQDYTHSVLCVMAACPNSQMRTWGT